MAFSNGEYIHLILDWDILEFFEYIFKILQDS